MKINQLTLIVLLGVLFWTSSNAHGHEDKSSGFTGRPDPVGSSTTPSTCDYSNPNIIVPPDWREAYCLDVLAGPHVVPIKLHVTLNSSNIPSVSQQQFDEVLEQLNSNFADGNIQFVAAGPIVEMSNVAYDVLERYRVGTVLFDELNDMYAEYPPAAGIINIYVPRQYVGYPGDDRTLPPFNFAPSGSSPWSDPSIPNVIIDYTRAIMRQSQFLEADAETLSHEIGHTLGLFHTHAPNRVNTASCTSELDPSDGVALVELVIREVNMNLMHPYPNCSPMCEDDPNNPYGETIEAGDLICDTPADPYTRISLGSCPDVLDGCNYTGILDIDGNGDTTFLLDLNGQRYQPDVSNYMSYYRCRSSFTVGQYDRMLYYILSFYGTNIDCLPECDGDNSAFSIQEECNRPNPKYLYCDICERGGELCVLKDGLPLDPSKYQVTFITDDEQGIKADANGCLRADGETMQKIDKVRILDEENQCMIGFDVQLSICMELTEEVPLGGGVFKSVNPTKGTLSDIAIFPNPAQGLLNIHNPHPQEVDLYLFTMDGQLRFSAKSAAGNTLQIAVDHLPAGIYFLQANDASNKQMLRTEKVILSGRSLSW